MLGYDNKELLNFITNKIGDCSVSEIRNQDLYNIIGQGISRTTFYYEEYPDIVFKIGIGDDDDCAGYAFEDELTNYQTAFDEGVEQYFAELESIGTVELVYEDWIWSEELQEDICREELIPYEIYIQPKADCTVGKVIWELEDSLKEEISLVEEEDCDGVALSTMVSALFIQKHGLDEYRRLSKFFEKVLYLDDLHNDNWALMGNRMVIIDYAM